MDTLKPFSKTKNNDETLDSFLRPSSWPEYMGQDRIKRNLKIILTASQKRKEPSDHLLFYGQAGLGKTTLAHLVAKEMRTNLKITSGPAIERAGDLAAILSNLENDDILFIDEMHRLNKNIEEILYPALESRKLRLGGGKGMGARMLTLDLPPFTLIGATTRLNLLSSPLRSRFGAIFRLDYYSVENIENIIQRSAHLMNLNAAPEAITLLARASRFTPRVANRLLRRSRDFSEANNLSEITSDVASQTLKLLEIDSLGLEAHDRYLLEIIIYKFSGGPVGISTLSAALDEESGTIEEVYEPYLLKLGLLKRTPKGRVATEKARKHLKIRSTKS